MSLRAWSRVWQKICNWYQKSLTDKDPYKTWWTAGFANIEFWMFWWWTLLLSLSLRRTQLKLKNVNKGCVVVRNPVYNYSLSFSTVWGILSGSTQGSSQHMYNLHFLNTYNVVNVETMLSSSAASINTFELLTSEAGGSMILVRQFFCC